MLKRSSRRGARQKASDQPAPAQSAPEPSPPPASPTTPTTPAQEYATLGPDAPIAWPSGARRVPVTGELSPHAVAALERMGVTTGKQ